MKVLERCGYLNSKFNIFDYGRGFEDNLRELHLNGIHKWVAPNFNPNEKLIASDVVSLDSFLNAIGKYTRENSSVRNSIVTREFHVRLREHNCQYDSIQRRYCDLTQHSSKIFLTDRAENFYPRYAGIKCNYI